ncbi:MAG: aminopeptidase [Erysipelotrichaceae bacterium]|nr:aminopeptidase [Erysipelotrichaceae bacterium]MBR5048959.1 aminopeptidase [Erysipelotrichaceae bacterium]
MISEELLRKYARLAVCSGVNVQPGQLLVINSDVRDHRFAELCTEEAYKAGAGEVIVEWSDENVSKMSYDYVATEVLAEVPQWAYDKREYVQNKGCCFLHIHSKTPGLLKDADPEKVKAVQIAAMTKMKPLREYTMNNHGQWCIVALPSLPWARKVFPNLDDEQAMDKLTEAILKSVRISADNDPVAEWKAHNASLASRSARLNEFNFDKLHFVSGNGTDLYVGLVRNHNWAGGSCDSTKGVEFNPNMPTEEVFCMPDRRRVDGKVVASKPLSYGGKVIEDFWFEFRDGRVERHGAEKEEATLTDLLNSDEGSRHLGEVALISYHSPISLMNILFYNTLFDENASCHLALGKCYSENIKNGENMSEQEIYEAGGNDSMNHVDFMFGTADMRVTGIREDGSEVTVFEDGDFVF